MIDAKEAARLTSEMEHGYNRELAWIEERVRSSIKIGSYCTVILKTDLLFFGKVHDALLEMNYKVDFDGPFMIVSWKQTTM